MDNPYKLRPFKLNVINIGRDPTIYIFLGDVPPAILVAANSFKRGKNGIKWDNGSETILKNFYGARWKNILSADYRPTESVNDMMSIYGGDQFDDFDNITVDNSGNVVDTNKYTYNSYKSNDASIIYSNISIYPEDTIEDIKNKIFIATNIQYCKQHLFYFLDNRITTTYDISIDESAIKPDILQFINTFTKLSDGSVRSGDTILGIPIDKYLEKYKNKIIIDPLEPFTSIIDHTN